MNEPADWKPFETTSKRLLYKKTRFETEYKFYFTDLINVWMEELTMEKLVSRCQELNPAVEASSEYLSEYVQSLVDDKNKGVEKEITERDGTLTLSLKSALSGVLFVYKFYLKLMDSITVFEELTLPLVFMVQEMQEREKLLFQQLRRKDREIAEYKMEGATLSRKNIETKEFNETDFIQNTSVELSDVEDPVRAFHRATQPLYHSIRRKLEDFDNKSNFIVLAPETMPVDLPKPVAHSQPETQNTETRKGIVLDDEADDKISGRSWLSQPVNKMPKKDSKKPKRVKLKL